MGDSHPNADDALATGDAGGNPAPSPERAWRNLEIWSGTMAEADERDRAQWRAATPHERLAALELIRALNDGYAEGRRPRPEFQRVYRVADIRER